MAHAAILPAAEATDAYERFGESRLWSRQREYFQRAGIDAWRRGDVPHYITSTAGAADAYADGIVAYWRAALAAGDIDAARPLYVLELGAGCGRFTYLLLRALRDRLASLPALRVCLVASDIVEANLDFIAGHPYLLAEVERGRLDTARWDAERGGPLRLRAQRTVVETTENPMVVIANYVFDGLRHDLFGFEYGQLYEGRVAVDDAGDEPEIDYQWRPIAQAEWLPRAWQSQIAHYAARLPNASMLFPSGALRCLEHVARLSRGRYLLLSADKGFCTERELRPAPATAPEWHGSFSLPVNYHALSACTAQDGGRAWNGCARADGLICHASLRSDGTVAPDAYDDGFREIVRRLDRCAPDDFYLLKKVAEAAAENLESDQLLALLRLGSYDYRLLSVTARALAAQSSSMTPDAQWRWRDALARCWDTYFPIGEEDVFSFRFGELAMRFQHWGLARRAFEFGIAVHGESAACLSLLAECELATGRRARALELIERAYALDPDDRACADTLARLRRRAGGDAALDGIATDGELTLECIELEHAAALLRQYRDPQIAVMSRLSELLTLEEAVEWIVEQRRDAARAVYAVMHADYGFIGIVSLSTDGDAGYFYFWIGVDHQGEGFGRRAAALLFEAAANNGIRDIFTSAYSDNARSRAALDALGFGALSLSARKPDHDLIFFHRSLGAHAAASAAARLKRLCAAIRSPLQFKEV